ncbi:MAG: hypothetical protein EKK68_14560 [Candidatus Competibacteraceae bacterium]|nr:MAG: hypothetical protein EKK68_14560 [Candidatus Competibacteraceae bacterium]
MPHREKCLESIHVHTGESLKRDLQDLAMLEGRAVGEYIRATLEAHVYGAKTKLLPFSAKDQACSAP